MRMLAVVGAAGVCAIAAWMGMHAAQRTETSLQPAVVEHNATQPIDPLGSSASERWADDVVCLQWRRPGDTWRRFLQSPDGTLVPHDLADKVATALTDVDLITLRLDQNAVWEHVATAIGFLPESTTGATSVGMVPAIDARLTVTASTTTTRRAWLDLLAYALGGSVLTSDAGPSVTVSAVGGASAHAWIDGSDVVMRVAAGTSPERFDAACRRVEAWEQHDDIEGRLLVVVTDPDELAKRFGVRIPATLHVADVALSIVDRRLRLRMQVPLSEWKRAHRARTDRAADVTAIEASAFDPVPSDALAAAATTWVPWVPPSADEPMDPAGEAVPIQEEITDWLIGLVVSPRDRAAWSDLYDALFACGHSAQGTAVAYLQPIGAAPSATVVIPCDVDTWRRALPSIAGHYRDKVTIDGDTLAAAVGPWRFHVAARGGRLIATMHPAGVDGLVAAAGAFATQADVTPALTASGSAPASTRVVIRVDRMLEFIGPMMAAMQVPSGPMSEVDEASRPSSGGGEPAWLVVREGKMTTIEAGGTLYAAAAALMQLRECSPGALLRVN